MTFRIQDVKAAAVSDADYVAHGRVRFHVYIAEKRWLPWSSDGQAEHDSYDLHSHMAVAYDEDGEAAGAVRNIYPTDVQLPIEVLFGLRPDPLRRSVEVSRLAIRSAYRSSRLAIGLFRWVVEDVCRNEVDDLYATVEESLLKTLNHVGFPFRPLGPPRSEFGGMIMPTVCAASDLVKGVAEQDALTARTPLAPYFRAPYSACVETSLVAQSSA